MSGMLRTFPPIFRASLYSGLFRQASIFSMLSQTCTTARFGAVPSNAVIFAPPAVPPMARKRPPSGFDYGLSLGDIFLRVSLRVSHVDFCDIVDGLLSLSMEAMHSRSTECSTRKHR